MTELSHEGKTLPAVEIMDLRRVYHTGSMEVLALRGVSFKVCQGDFVAIKGRSGSGKTTLLNCIAGLDQPTSGKVLAFGIDLSHLKGEQVVNWRREQVGVIFQSFGLLPTLSAYENIELVLRLRGIHTKERQARTIQALEWVGLRKWMHHRPNEMSGGQQQRVGIARALANHPRLILADEPTGELDSTTAKEILGLFRQIIQNEQITIILVSHDQLVDEYVDYMFTLKDGQIVRREA